MKSGLSVPYGSPNLYNPSSVRHPLSSTYSENKIFEKISSNKTLCPDRSIISDPENIIGTSPKSQLKINEFSSRLLHLDYRPPVDFRSNVSENFQDSLLNSEQKFASTHHDTSFNELSKGGQLHSPNIKDSSLRALSMLKVNTTRPEKIFVKKSPGKGQNKTTKCLQEIRKLSQPNQNNQVSYISRINPVDKVDLFNQIIHEKEYSNSGKAWPDEKKHHYIDLVTPKEYKGISINTDLRSSEVGLLPRNLNIQRPTVRKEQGINIFKCEKKEVRESVNSPLKNTGDESPTQCQDSPIRVNIVRALENKTKGKNDIKNFSIFAFPDVKKKEEKPTEQASKMSELNLIPVTDLDHRETENVVSENLTQDQIEKIGPHTKMLHIAPRKPDCVPVGRKRLPESVQLNLEKSVFMKTLDKKLSEVNCSEYMQDLRILEGVLDFMSLTCLCRMTRVCKKYRTEDYARLIRKAQCKVIIQGPKEEDQYGFWDFFVNFDFLQKKYPLQYMMNSLKTSTYERDILSDIDRTYTFNELGDSRQGSLLKVLIAFSNAVPKIGYIQGLNSIAAVFLSHKVTEPEAYWLMKYIFKKKKFDELMTDEFSKVQLLTYQLEIYMRNYLPEIIDHLGENGMNISYFATQWFITMFAYDLELTHLTKIWNMFFIKGWKVLIRVALTILWHFQTEICRQSSDELPSFLKSFVRERIKEIPENDLFGVALSFKVSNRLLKGLETLYEHSAPINVLLVSSPNDKLEWKIVSEECSSMDVSTAAQKDIMEYLNENIDQARLGKSKNCFNRQDHHKHNSEAANISLALDDVSTEYGMLHKPLHNLNAKFTDQTFIQTLSNFGQKLKQILTPKDHNQDSFFLGRKVSNVKPFEIVNDKETESQAALTDRSQSRSNQNSNVKNRKLVVSNDSVGGTPFKKSIITSLKDRNNKLGINLFDPLNFNLQKDRDSSQFMSGHKTTTASIHEAVFHTERKSSMTEAKMTKHKRNSSFNQEATHFLGKSQTLCLGQIIDRRNEELGIISRRNTEQFKSQLKLGKTPSMETNQSLYFDHLSRNNSLHNNTLHLPSEYYMNYGETGRKRGQRGYALPLNLTKVNERG